MGFSIVTRSGVQRWCFDVLAVAGGASYRSSWPGGDADAQFAVAFGLHDNPPGLTPGNLCLIYDGPVEVYGGVLGVPQRGTPWTVTAQGLASLADRYLPLDPDGDEITLDPNVAVDYAIERGLPWRRTGTLPLPTSSPASLPNTVGELLELAATMNRKRWSVNARGAISMGAEPTSPDYVLISNSTPGGRGVDDFATDVWVRYTTMVTVPKDGGGTTQVQTSPHLVPAPDNPAASVPRPFGRWERIYDSTPAGSMGSVPAGELGDGALALAQPRASFSSDLAVAPGELLTIGGQPVRLSQVRAGERVRILGTQPDPALGELSFTTSVDVTIGAWSYDTVSGAGILTPMGSYPRDLQSLLTAAAKQPRKTAPRGWQYA